MNKVWIVLLSIFVSCSNPVDTAHEGIELALVDKLQLTELSRGGNVDTVTLNSNALQTFFKVRARVNNQSYTQQKVYWYSNDYWYVYFVNKLEKVPIINQASYVTDDGYAYNMGAVNIQLQGRTVTIYGYYEKYNTRYIDSVKIYVN